MINLKYDITDNFLQYWWLKYSIINNEFFFDKKLIKLTKKSKYLLFIFLWNNEKLLSEQFLIEKIWWDLDMFIKRNIRIDILRLKNQINYLWIDTWINNIRWEGYIFKRD